MPGIGCVTDPCSLVGCPPDTKCSLSQTGVPQCVEKTVEQNEDSVKKGDYVYTTGGGGLGGCSVSANRNRSALTTGLGLLAFLFLYFRRRKSRALKG
jgi:hypothetical protein